MVHRTRFVTRRSPNLQQEIIEDSGNITGVPPQVGLTNKILDIAKEVGDVILRLIIIDFFGENTVTEAAELCQCAVISKPISEGVPSNGDWTDERYVVSEYATQVGPASVLSSYHWRQNLGIKVPAGNDVYIQCRKKSVNPVRCGFYIRLFWQSL